MKKKEKIAGINKYVVMALIRAGEEYNI